MEAFEWNQKNTEGFKTSAIYDWNEINGQVKIWICTKKLSIESRYIDEMVR